jgi:hypothetical protein
MRAIIRFPNYVSMFLDKAREAARYKSIPSQICDAVIHKLAINTAFRDYHKYGFYKPGMTMEEKSRYVGYSGSRYWPYENNLPKFATTLTDKYIQKTLLKGFELPTAELLTTIGHQLEIRDIETFRTFLETCDQDVVLKPVSSAMGQNILVLSKVGGHFESGGETMSVLRIWEHMRPHLERGLLIEARLRNIPEIDALYPNSLNSFRVVTIKTNDGRWHAPGGMLKLGAGGSEVDNLSSGGLQVCIDEDCKTYNPFDHDKGETVTRHPDTGANLDGITLECYRDAVDLALRASEKFCFMGTIGWDIAATPDGPMIVEGNTRWAPRLQRPSRGLITDEIATGLRRHNALSDLFSVHRTRVK